MGNAVSSGSTLSQNHFDQHLVSALESNQIEKFKEAVHRNVDTTASDKENSQKQVKFTCSYLATIYDNIEVLAWLIGSEICGPNEADENGRTLLHFAAKEGCLQSLAYLVEKAGSMVEMTDREGYTPFLSAVVGGQLSCAKYLSSKMKPEMERIQILKDGRTSVHLCAQEGQVAVLRWLVNAYPLIQTDRVEKIEGMTAFQLAARFGHATVLDFLLRHCGVDTNIADSNGKTALHHASSNDHIDAVRYLVEQACLDPYAVDNSGLTSVDYAAKHSSGKVSQYFSQLEQLSDFI